MLELNLSRVRAVLTSMTTPKISSAPTVDELPGMKQLELKRREWALIERLATGHTSAGFVMFAECGSCHASVQGWREHLRDVVDLAPPGDDGPGVRVAYPQACDVCGGSIVDVFAEPRRPNGPQRQ